MRTGSCLFLAGILALIGLSSLPSIELVWFLPICIGAGFYFPHVRWPAWFLSGFLWALFCAHGMLFNRLMPEFEGKVVHINGYVSSLPEKKEHSTQFDLRVDSFIYKQKRVEPAPKILRLNWYHPSTAILPGDRLDIRVKLKRPHGFMNPGGFDYEGWLFLQSIDATGYVVNGTVVQGKNWQRYFSIHWYRYQLRARLENVLAEIPMKAWIYALTLGDRSGLNQDQWRILNNSGTNHLLAISGLHIGLIAAFAYFLARWLWPLAGRAALFIPTPRIAAVVSLFAALVYSGLAGFTIPTRRAVIMLGIVLSLSVFSRITTVSHTLVLALLAVLIFDPFSAMSAGFWLSFTAVALIAFALSAKTDDRSSWRRWGQAQWYIFLGLAPLLAFWFQQIPLLSIFANSIAIPWVSLITVPAVLSGTVWLFIAAPVGEILLHAGAGSLAILETFLEFVAGIDNNLLLLPQVSVSAVFAALTGTSLLLMPRGFPGKWIGVFWLFPLLFPHIDTPANGEFRFTLLEVGQGLAAVVQTREHVLVYDAGPRFSRDFNAGWAVVIPYLRKTGQSKVDIQILSHGDNDHAGGLPDIVNTLQVETILTSVPDVVADSHSNVKICRSGQNWQWDGVYFEILHPRAGRPFAGNNGSCVLKISSGPNSVLLAGDIEQQAERDLLENAAAKLEATVLVAPHHGSKTSSTRNFIRAISPEYVLFAVGYLNRFKFPNQDIIERYNDVDAELFDTSRDGAIKFNINADEVSVATERENAARFWHISL